MWSCVETVSQRNMQQSIIALCIEMVHLSVTVLQRVYMCTT